MFRFLRSPRLFRNLILAIGLHVLLGSGPVRAQNATPPAKASAQEPPLTPAQQELDTQLKQGLQHLDKAEYDAAEKILQAGYKTAQVQGDERMQAAYLNAFGLLAEDRGRHALAMDFLERGLKLREKLKLARETALSLNNMAGVAMEQGRFDKMLDYSSRAADILETMNDPRALAVTYHAMGAARSHLGQYERALDAFTRAQNLYEKAGDAMGVGDEIVNRGMMYADLRQYDKATQVFAYGQTLAIIANVPIGVAYSHMGLGLMNWFQGRYADCRDHFARALAYYEKHEKQSIGPLYIAYCHAGIAMGDWGLHRYDDGLKHITLTDAVVNKGSNQRDIAIAAGIRGLLCAGAGRYPEAEVAFARLLDTYERMGEQVTEASALDLLLYVMPHTYARAATASLHCGHLERAFAIVERGRGQGLAKQAAQNRLDFARFLTPAEREDLERRTEELTIQNNLLRALLSRDIPSDAAEQKTLAAQRADAETRRQDAERRLTQLRDSLRVRHPEYSRLHGYHPPTPAALRAFSRLHPDTLYLEYALVDDTSTLLFALQAGNLRVLTLPVGDQKLHGMAQAWNIALQNRHTEEPARARALYAALIRPVEQAGLLRFASLGRRGRAGARAGSGPTSCKRLVIVCDGPLLDIPFAALADARGTRLIERVPISTAPSLGVLTWPQEPITPTGTLLCVTDPEGGLSRRERGGFGALPNARREGRSVADLFSGARFLTGRAARESEIKRMMGRYTLLHFATHGIADGRNGMRSCLVLAPEAEGGKEDGFLEAREIVGMRLAAKLAVLSACETAQGQESGGEGLLGLAWAFRAAGCPSVIASQWAVDDAATSRLMTAFYQELKSGKSKDEALRRAMLTVKREKPAPFYWAAFQVIGDTQSLPIN